MKKHLRLGGLLLVLAGLILWGPVAVQAQTMATPTTGARAGLLHVVSRVYAPPSVVSGTPVATPSAVSGTPMATPSTASGIPVAMPSAVSTAPGATPASGSGLNRITAEIQEYGTAKEAAAAFSTQSPGFGQGFERGASGVKLAKTTVSGIGQMAVALTGAGPIRGVNVKVMLLAVQQDQYLYFAVVVTGGLDPQAPTIAFTKAMIAMPASSSPAAFHTDGTSTGGLWAKLPKAGNFVLDGLTPVMDMALK